jgi:hypothetical protein
MFNISSGIKMNKNNNVKIEHIILKDPYNTIFFNIKLNKSFSIV